MGAEHGKRWVVDASVVLKWVLDATDEPGQAEARALLERWLRREVELFVPTLWTYEVGNILLRKLPTQAAERLEALQGLGLAEVEMTPRLAASCLALASSRSLTFYDAAYLAVAFAVGGTLVTADAKLLRALIAEDPALALGRAI